MSTVLHRRELNVAITAEESGVEFAAAPSDIQKAFVISVLDECSKWRKPGQSVYYQLQFIAEEMTPADRQRVVDFAQLVVEYFSPV